MSVIIAKFPRPKLSQPHSPSSKRLSSHPICQRSYWLLHVGLFQLHFTRRSMHKPWLCFAQGAALLVHGFAAFCTRLYAVCAKSYAVCTWVRGILHKALPCLQIGSRVFVRGFAPFCTWLYPVCTLLYAVCQRGRAFLQMPGRRLYGCLRHLRRSCRRLPNGIPVCA